MLVVDVKDRATLQEIMCHPWMTKGYNGPPENFLPQRDPVQLPLDSAIVNKMQGFDFGPAKYIEDQITRIVESDDYQSAVRRLARDESLSGGAVGDRKRGMFEFYKRRNSTSREGLSAPSMEAIRGYDPLNAYSPLLSVYLLAKEKLERERAESNPGAFSLGTEPNAPALKMPGLPSPEQAHTNTFTPEMPGETTTGGRSRARSRTNGEDEVAEGIKHVTINEKPSQAMPSPRLEAPSSEPPRKEGTAMGLLRRFSTRRNKDRSESDRPPPPSFNIQPPQDSATAPKKSFSVRRSRRREQSPPTIHTGGSQGQHEGLLSTGGSKGRSLLSRSTSVNSADYRPRRFMNRGASEATESPRLAPEPQATSGSEQSSLNAEKAAKAPEMMEKSQSGAPTLAPRTPTTARTKSLGHSRHDSVQSRRQKREEARSYKHDNVPEETDAELQEDAAEAPIPHTPGAEVSRPAGLKGLFSSSTTSSKPPQFIRHDLIRVLQQLGVEFTEVRGGFVCRHAPSINLDDVRDINAYEDEKSGRVSSTHNRRISFNAFRNRDRDETREEKLHRQQSRRRQPDQSFVTNSEGSDEYVHSGGRPQGDNQRDMGATSTRVQEDTGERLVLRFEIAIVKIPLFNLHGIQFKKVQGGMNQYRSMTSTILGSLRL